MIKIVSSNSVPHVLCQLRQWFELEWGHIDPFEGNHPDIVIPSPLVAVDERESLLGGLSFTSAPKPKQSEIGVWINMILVAASQRKKGIASQLIQAAEVEAQRIGVHELFVFTEFPDLYRKLGWQVVGLDGNDRVLTKVLVAGRCK